MKYWNVVVRVKSITPIELYAKMGRQRMQKNITFDRECVICQERITRLPIIKCLECKKCEVFLCIPCFQLGAEAGEHRRGHNYELYDASGRAVFDFKKANTKKWGCYEDLALLEAALEYKIDDEWTNIAMSNFGKASTPREAYEHLDRYFLRGKIGQHVLSEMTWPSFSVMVGNTEKTAEVVMKPTTNIPASKYADLVSLIRNADVEDLPNTSQKNWFDKIETLKVISTPKFRRSTRESRDQPSPKSPSPMLRSRRFSSRSIKEEFGLNGKRSSFDIDDKPSTSKTNEPLEHDGENGLEEEQDSDQDEKPDFNDFKAPLKITIKRRLSTNSNEAEPLRRVLRSQTSMISPGSAGSLNRVPTRYSLRSSGRLHSRMSRHDDDEDEEEMASGRRNSLRSSLRRVTIASESSDETSDKEEDDEGTDEDEGEEEEEEEVEVKPKKQTRSQKATPKTSKKKPSPQKTPTKGKTRKPSISKPLMTEEEMVEYREKYPDPYFYSHGHPILDEDAISKLKTDDLNLLGYLPKRDDFEEECNWDAEKLISRLTFLSDPDKPASKDEHLINETKFILLSRYNRLLKKRLAKHGVLREHELVNEFFTIVKNNPSERDKYNFINVPLFNQEKRKFYAPLFGRVHQVLDKILIDELIKNVAKTDFLMDRIETLQKLQRDGVTKVPAGLTLDTHAMAARTSTIKRRRRKGKMTNYANKKAILKWQRIKRWQKKINETNPDELDLSETS